MENSIKGIKYQQNQLIFFIGVYQM